MPSTVIPSAILPRISETPGCLAASSLARARTEGVSSISRQGGGPQAVLGLAGRALVGDLEDADLVDGVAEELDPQRVLLRRREHVEQSAAHRELAALGDHLDAGVADVDEPRDHVLWVGFVSDGEPDGHQVAEAADDRLQHGADGRDDNLERPGNITPGGMTSIFPGGTTPPVTPLRTGESLPRSPLAGAKPRDGAFGAACVTGGCGRPHLRVPEAAQHRDPLPDRVRPG